MDWQQYAAQNQNSMVRYGITHLGNETIPSITIHGPATMNGTNILELAEINGLLNATKASFNRLHMNGNFQGQEVSIKEGEFNGSVGIIKSKVTGTISIYGLLIASESEFLDKIIFDSSEIYISNSKVQDILVLNSSEYSPAQKIYLKEGTVIKGTIIFNSGKGEVVVSSDSVISQSQVVGGKIVSKD